MRNLSKAYFRRSFQAALIMSTTVTIEIVVPSLLYLTLSFLGISRNIVLLTSSVAFIGLIILSLPFLPTPIFILRGNSNNLTWKLPDRIRLLLSKSLSIPKEFIHWLRIFTLILFIIGSILILLGVSEFTHDHQVIMSGQATTATILGNDCSHQVVCVPTVEFQTQSGKFIQASTRCCATVPICVLGRCINELVAIGEGAVIPVKGQKVPVLYNPGNPKEVQLQIQGSSQTPLALQTVDFLTYGIIFMFFGLISSLFIFTLALSKFLVSQILALEHNPTKMSNKDNKYLKVKQKEENQLKD